MKTLIYIENLERLHFYQNIMNTLENKKEFIVITNKLSVYLKTFLRYKTYLLRDYHLLNKLVSKYQFELLLIWNGSTVIRKTLGNFFRTQNIPIKFLEISNLPNKLFHDPIGTNAASLLYTQPEILDQYEVSDEEYQIWKENYLQQKSIVKQAKNRHTIRYLMVFDYLGYLFGAIQEDFRNPFYVLKNKLKNKKSKQYEIADLKSEFIFFPLQVSNDTQILEHSDIDNIQAIEYLKTAYDNKKILIKIHPAEEDNEFISQIERMQTKNLIIVSNDTKELIAQASKIITINSTVGLEAMIMEKDVEILGRALYKNFDQKRLKNYICRYLINIDYFGNNYKEEEVLRFYE